MLGQAATSVAAVRRGAQRHGVPEGGRKQMEMEMEAAAFAEGTGVYVVWRCDETGNDCCRVGPRMRCFCGHSFHEHAVQSLTSRKPVAPRCLVDGCPCTAYRFVPSRPEEVGDWWLPRRPGPFGRLRVK